MRRELKERSSKFFCLLIYLTFFTHGSGTTLLVSNLNDSGPGSLRSQAAAAVTGDTLDLTTLSGVITLTSGQIDCSNKTLTLNGPGAAILTISGNNNSRILYTSNGSLYIHNLRFENGRVGANEPSYSSGAVIASYETGDLTVTNCIFENNRVDANFGRSGAIDAVDINPVGGQAGGSKHVSIQNCHFENNQAYIAGAIRFRTSAVNNLFELSNCSFQGNSTFPVFGNDGGAVECIDYSGLGAQVHINNCTFYGNSTIGTGNARSGGALSILGCNTQINSCTIVNNSAGGDGGGIYYSSTAGSTCLITNTIISGNTTTGQGADIYGSFVSGGFNIIGTNGTTNGFNNTSDQNTTNPQTQPIANNGGLTKTCAIGCASPAIDMGGGNPVLDQRGLPRICSPDVGAYEYQTSCNCGIDVTMNPAEDTICDGGCTTLQLNIQGATPPYTVVWNNGLPPTTNTQTVCPIATTTYTAIVTDATGLVDTASVQIAVLAPPTVHAWASRDTICEGETVQLEAAGATQFQWLPLLVSGNVLNVSPSSSSTYSVIGYNGICTDTAVVTVTVLPPPSINLSINSITINEAEQKPFVLSGNASNADSCVVDFGDGTIIATCDWDGLSHDYSHFGQYTITITSFNAFGCPSSQSITVSYTSFSAIYVPNAFTPNSDEYNTIFRAQGENIKEFHIEIYNKWGEILFESNDMNSGWDGTYNGKICPDGVYTYSIITKDRFGKVTTHNGHLTLMR